VTVAKTLFENFTIDLSPLPLAAAMVFDGQTVLTYSHLVKLLDQLLIPKVFDVGSPLCDITLRSPARPAR
jgi:hypothetical protein